MFFASLTPYTYVSDAVNAVKSKTRPEVQNVLVAGARVNVLASRTRQVFRAPDIAGTGSNRAASLAGGIVSMHLFRNEASEI